jgi:hypothetical protein
MFETGAALVACLEELLRRIEESRNLADSDYISVQQPVGDLAKCIWQFRRGNYSRLFHLSLVLAPGGPVSKLAAANGWLESYEERAAQFRQDFARLNGIRYAGSERCVELGDHVVLRGMLRQRSGRVSYLPGVSQPRAAIDFGGLFRVGIELAGGGFTAVHVDPESLELRRTVRFVKLDSRNPPAVPSDSDLER